MATYYVDLSAAVNGTGTIGSPFNDFTSVNAGLWDGNEILVRRGSSKILNSSTRANVTAATGCLIDVYGDAAAPLPVLSGGGVNFNPIWLQSGANITVRNMHVTQAPGSGLVCSPFTGQTLNNIVLEDILATQNTQNSTLWGTDGVQIGGFAASQPDNTTRVTNVIARRIIARDNGGHGFKARGISDTVQIFDSTALRSGLRTPAHGCGSAGEFIGLNVGGTDGQLDITTGWSLVSGSIYERTITHPSVTNINFWHSVYVLGANPIYRLPFVASPTPGPGQCGTNGPNNLRINLSGGAVTNPALLTSMQVIVARPINGTLVRCIGAYTIDGVTKLEGDGVYFDNGTERYRSLDCVGINNQGNGGFMNDNTDCGHYRLTAFNNSKGGIAITRGVNTRVHGSVLYCLPGTNGIRYQTGNVGVGNARQNTIINANIGIWTNDSGTNIVNEDENLFVNCTTRLTNVTGPGALSRDISVLPATRTNYSLADAIERIGAAELMI